VKDLFLKIESSDNSAVIRVRIIENLTYQENDMILIYEFAKILIVKINNNVIVK